MTKLALATAFSALLVIAPASAAEPAKPAPQGTTETAASPLPEVAAFEQAVSARQVADFARRHKDPQAMIVAARMLQEVPFRDAAADASGGPAAFSPAGLFAEAKTLAKGDPALLMQITIAQSSGSRGVLSSVFGSGLVRSVQSIGARAAYRFAIKVKGGEPLRIGAIGDVGTAMLLRLVDAKGKLACHDDNGDYAPVCAVRPNAATDYRVELVNRSNAPTRAVILSN